MSATVWGCAVMVYFIRAVPRPRQLNARSESPSTSLQARVRTNARTRSAAIVLAGHEPATPLRCPEHRRAFPQRSNRQTDRLSSIDDAFDDLRREQRAREHARDMTLAQAFGLCDRAHRRPLSGRQLSEPLLAPRRTGAPSSQRGKGRSTPGFHHLKQDFIA